MSRLAILKAIPARAVADHVQTILPVSSPTEQGRITLDAFLMRPAWIIAADTDSDGRGSKTEMIAAQGKGNPVRMFDQMDANHDGYLDRDEIRNVLIARLHRLDIDGDGLLSPDERMPKERAQSAPADQQPS